ncbi:MAG: leucyl aminopeptidase, partial [Hydrogenophaga sp.]|nr:leucyl aminopeptidase [Hydrogenophaga sp.]
MDFELKSLSPNQAAQLATDALLVLVPDAKAGKAASGALHELVTSATEHGDLEPGVAKQLACYRPAGFKAARVLLVRVG